MYGAILGDIVGSRFEFDREGWTKDFELLTYESKWTDDTVMTIAIAEALMDAGKDAPVGEIEAACIKSMQKWGQKYPYAGYGARFIHWVSSKDPRPYGSFGNVVFIRYIFNNRNSGFSEYKAHKRESLRLRCRRETRTVLQCLQTLYAWESDHIVVGFGRIHADVVLGIGKGETSHTHNEVHEVVRK